MRTLALTTGAHAAGPSGLACVTPGALQPPGSSGAEEAESTLPLETELVHQRGRNEFESVAGSGGSPGVTGSNYGGNMWVCQELRSEAPPYESGKWKGRENRKGPQALAGDMEVVTPQRPDLGTRSLTQHLGTGTRTGHTQEEGTAVF